MRRKCLTSHRRYQARSFDTFCEEQQDRIFSRLFVPREGVDPSVHAMDARRKAALRRLKEGSAPVEEMEFERRGRS